MSAFTMMVPNESRLVRPARETRRAEIGLLRIFSEEEKDNGPTEKTLNPAMGGFQSKHFPTSER